MSRKDWRAMVEPAGDCLVWTGRRDANGYARIGGKWAHRVVYEREVGPIPEGRELDHTCNNPPCVNTKHLEPVTRAEHVRRTFERLGVDRRHLSAAYLRAMNLTYREIAETLEYAARESAASAVNAAIRKGLVAADDIPRAHHLTDEDRADIIALREFGVPVNDIAEWYGIHPSQASRVSRGMRSGRSAA